MRRLVAINTVFFGDYRWHFWAHVWRTPILGELSMLVMNRPMFAQELRRGSSGISDAHIDRTFALDDAAHEETKFCGFIARPTRRTSNRGRTTFSR